MNVTTIADELFRELGEPNDISIPAIIFWLTSNIGALNNYIGTSFVIINPETAPAIDPELSENQKVIFKLLYWIHYFKRQVSKNLGAAAYQNILEIKEGNRSVKRMKKTDVAAAFGSQLKELKSDLSSMILAYKMNAAAPLCVSVLNPIYVEAFFNGTSCYMPWGYGGWRRY